jgi:hypothetical protein
VGCDIIFVRLGQRLESFHRDTALVMGLVVDFTNFTLVVNINKGKAVINLSFTLAEG